MLLEQFLDVIPVRGRPLPVQQTGLADDLGSGAHPDDRRALRRLALEPSENRRVVMPAHLRNDDVVGAVRMLRIERATVASGSILSAGYSVTGPGSVASNTTSATSERRRMP